MSKNYWQIKKQAEQLPRGIGPTSRIEAYVETWRRRCYPDSIPDDLPDGLLFSGRAPSWKAIAICLLQNDFRLHKLGYTTTPGEWAQAALDLSRESASDQLPLWGIAVTSKGFSPAVLSAVRQRANGWCERCGLKRGYEFHHRRPRGMGGSKLANTNMTSNALMLCRDCHADIESERTAAINQGWLITQNHSPTDIPVYYRGAWVYLDDLGNLQPVQETL